MGLKDIVAGIISPVAGVFQKREERKTAVQTIRATTAATEVDGKVAIELTKAQWDLTSKQLESGTWKDEYITIVITSPLVCILVGSMIAAFTGDSRMLMGVEEALATINEVGIDMGELMFFTVLAALGLKTLSKV